MVGLGHRASDFMLICLLLGWLGGGGSGDGGGLNATQALHL